LPVILFGVFFSPAVIGFYALALRLLQAPMVLLGSAISQVFHEKAATARLEGTLSELVRITFRKLVSIGVFPILVTGVFAVELFGFVFGEKWVEAGLYAAILSPWLSLMFVSSPISILTAVIDLQRFSLTFNSLIFIFRGLAIIVGGLQESVLLALALFSLVGTFGYLIKILIINYYSGVSAKTTLIIITKPCFSSMLILIIYSTFKIIGIEGLIYVLMYFLLILFWSWRLNLKGFLWKRYI
jgi:O-antigen/teichoic acid export membrane protein